jgi:hypothetical protein
VYNKSHVYTLVRLVKDLKDPIIHILVSMIYFDTDMSKSTNTVVYFEWKTVIYIYACGKCRTQFM